MDRYHTNRLAMLRATLAHFDQHPDAWQTNTALARNVQLVRTATDTMIAAGDGQVESDTAGLTENKQEARARLADLLVKLGQRAVAFALETGDANLRRAVDYSPSEWKRMSEATFLSKSDHALDQITAHLDALGDYGVTAEEITAAREARTTYQHLAPERDNVRADRVAATDRIEQAYREARQPLEVLDRLVPTLITDAAFVAEYENVRRIVGD